MIKDTDDLSGVHKNTIKAGDYIAGHEVVAVGDGGIVLSSDSYEGAGPSVWMTAIDQDEELHDFYTEMRMFAEVNGEIEFAEKFREIEVFFDELERLEMEA